MVDVRCYLDESSVNRGAASPVAVVAGLLLQQPDFFWIDVAWKRVIDQHLPGKSFIHMKDFGRDGDLADLSTEKRRDLFRGLTRVILRHKLISIAGKLTHSDFEHHFSFLSRSENRSIHGMCFLLTAVVMTKWADVHGYPYGIPFLLDEGCPDSKDIDATHDFMVSKFTEEYPNHHFGSLAWGDDEKIVALQAADVVAWSTRRRAANDPFTNGFEPLLDLFDGPHEEHNFEGEWMAEVASKLRSTLGR